MKDYDTIKEELIMILKKYHVQDSDKIKEIYESYLKNYIDFRQYVIGNLDTFKKAACVRLAVLECKINQDERKNDQAAIEISVELIKNPICYIGAKYDKEFKMDSISIEPLKENEFLWNRYLEDNLKEIQLRRDQKKFSCAKIINVNSAASDLEFLYHEALISQKSDQYEGDSLKKVPNKSLKDTVKKKGIGLIKLKRRRIK